MSIRISAATQASAGGRLRLSKRGCHLLAKARWMLGYVLVAETAFQYLLKTWSEVLEVLLFTTITGGFLVTTFVLRGFKGLAGIATGTWVQRLATLFLATLALSFLWGDQSLRSLLALFRLPTYLIIIAMVAETLRKEERIPTLAWITVGSITLIYTLAFVEFFFGSEVLGLQCAAVEKCLQRHGERWRWQGYLLEGECTIFYPRAIFLTVSGNAYGPARLGLFGLLAFPLSMGIILTANRLRTKLMAAGFGTFTLCGIILTGSRSAVLAILGQGVVFVVVAAWSAQARHHVRALIVANLAIGAIFLLSSQLPLGGPTATSRLTDFSKRAIQGDALVTEQPRIRNWRLAWDIFLNNPVGGKGFRTFPRESSQRFRSSIVGVHNGYLKVLAESGLLGMLPFLALLVFAATLLLAPTAMPSEGAAVWRIAFSAAFVGILIVNLVDVHSQDRYFWAVLGLAAGLETWRRKVTEADVGEHR